jgi:y4mF family transcriptional regulator
MRSVRTVRDLAAVVRARRRERGWSQADLAATADVSRQWVVAVESGTAWGAELGKVLAVLDALDIPLTIPEQVDAPQAATTTAPQPPPSDDGWSLDDHLRSFRVMADEPPTTTPATKAGPARSRSRGSRQSG